MSIRREFFYLHYIFVCGNWYNQDYEFVSFFPGLAAVSFCSVGPPSSGFIAGKNSTS